MQRVVVTGIGMLSPLGMGVEENWQQISLSKSGIRRIEDASLAALRCKIVGKVWDYHPQDHFSSREIRRYDRFIQYAMLAGKEALYRAQLQPEVIANLDQYRIGVAVGSGIGGLDNIDKESNKLATGNAGKISPFFVPGTITNMASGILSMQYGLRGPNLSVVSACATGAHNIIAAAQSIQSGLADIMVAGSAEYASTNLGIAGFAAMRALSENDNPETASRPWDKNRDGFVLSDGAGILVLESYAHAKQRKAPILAELVGYGMNADGHHLTQPDPEGKAAMRCMQKALQRLGNQRVDYVNAHATSTPLGDLVEPYVLKQIYGDDAKKVPISSTKSMHGHMLGAAGAYEACVSILALIKGQLPATINCDDPDHGCDLDFVREGMRDAKIEYALSNSFGFGGTNAALALRKMDSYHTTDYTATSV